MGLYEHKIWHALHRFCRVCGRAWKQIFAFSIRQSPYTAGMTPRFASLLALATAIVAETSATTALKASVGFTRLWPSVVVVLGYATAFYCMTIALRTLPIGVVYAICPEWASS